MKFLACLVGSLATSSSRIILPLLNILVSSGNLVSLLYRCTVLIPLVSYLNNPEILSGATFFGLALITASKSVLSLALVSNLSYWWFLKTVEK